MQKAGKTQFKRKQNYRNTKWLHEGPFQHWIV